MIDWWSVVANAFWILGLAVLLAAISYSYWSGGQERTSLRKQMAKPGFLRVLAVALALIGVGLAGTSQTTGERVLSVLLILGSGLFFLTVRQKEEA
jgi:hypothetical protein